MSLLEKLAEHEHQRWSHWFLYQAEKTKPLTDGGIDHWYKQQEQWQRWLKLAQTPYENLTEKEKESDRECARKILAIIEKET